MMGTPGGDGDKTTVKLNLKNAHQGLSCMSLCQSGMTDEECQVVVGGEKCLAIVDVKRNTEETELPSLKVSKYLGGRRAPTRITDVKWHPLDKNLIATATASGPVVVWDCEQGRPSILKREDDGSQRTEHNRLVKRVCWHPSNKFHLLSASTDSTVKLWDTRTFREQPPVTFRLGPDGNAPEIRDVEVDPFNHNGFVCSTDESAELLYWDIRMCERGPTRRILAGMGSISSINWHPKKNGFLVAGSKDGTVRVWNLRSEVADSSLRPESNIQTLASVGRVHWRPCPNGISHQIAEVSYSPLDADLNIWDERSPLLPLCCVRKPHGENISDIEWWGSDGEIIFSSARTSNGSFAASLVKRSHVHTAHLCTTAVVWGPSDTLVYHNSPIHFPEAGRHRGKIQKDVAVDNFPSTPMGSSELFLPQNSNSMPSTPLNIPRDGEKRSWFGKVFGRKRSQQQPIYSPDGTISYEQVTAIQSTSSVSIGTTSVLKQQSYSCPPPFCGESSGVSIYAEDQSNQSEFERLALSYKMTAASAIELCEYNASVTSSDELYCIWKVVQSLCELAISQRTEESQNVSTEDHVDHHKEGGSGNSRGSVRSQSSVKLEMESWESDSQSSSSSGPHAGKVFGESLRLENSSDSLSSAMSKTLPQASVVSLSSVFSDLIENILEAGDVQTVAMLALAVATTPEVFIPSAYGDRGGEWFMCYYNLLVSYDLVTIAAELVKHCPFRKIASMSQAGTEVSSRCSTCKDPSNIGELSVTSMSSSQLQHNCCYASSYCSACLQPVKGLFMWSRGCSHGGHVSCMQTWMKTSKQCPHVDCGKDMPGCA